MSENAAILVNDRIKLGCGYWVGLMLKLGFNTQEPDLYIQKKRFVVCSWFQGLEDLRENSLKCLQMFVVSSFSARKYEPSSVLLEENRPRKIYDSTFELSETSKRPIFIFSIINQVCRP